DQPRLRRRRPCYLFSYLFLRVLPLLAPRRAGPASQARDAAGLLPVSKYAADHVATHPRACALELTEREVPRRPIDRCLNQRRLAAARGLDLPRSLFELPIRAAHNREEVVQPWT